MKVVSPSTSEAPRWSSLFFGKSSPRHHQGCMHMCVCVNSFPKKKDALQTKNTVFQKKPYTPENSPLEAEMRLSPIWKGGVRWTKPSPPRPSDRRMPKAGKGYWLRVLLGISTTVGGWNPGKLTSWGWLVVDIYHYLQGLGYIPGFLNHQQLVLGMAHMQCFFWGGWGWRFAISEVVSAGHGLQVS